MTQTFLDYLNRTPLSSGLGTKDAPCSIAAVNLYTTGELTDEIPDCMSLVLGKFIIRVQDAMPDQLRNSPDWKGALSKAPGTGRDKEEERLDLILQWWRTVRNAAAEAAAAAAADPDDDAARVAANAAANAAADARVAANAAVDAAYSAEASRTARASRAAHADDDAADADAAFWIKVDPAGLLERAISVQ